jgi:hypothetical protein
LRAVDPVAGAVELVKCWLADMLCGQFPETPTDRAIRERDRRFTDDPDQQRTTKFNGAAGRPRQQARRARRRGSRV